MVGVSLGFLFTHMGSSSRAVMTISDIEIRNLTELLGDGLDGFFVPDHPQRVTNAVLAHEVILGSGLSGAVDDVLERAIVGECQEYRLDVGIVDLDMVHAVGFFLTAGEFVLLDTACEVVLNAGAYDEAILGAAIHGLSIDVVAILVILNQPALVLELLEVLNSLVIDLGLVFACTGFKVDFGLNDVIQRHLVVASLGTSLFA